MPKKTYKYTLAAEQERVTKSVGGRRVYVFGHDLGTVHYFGIDYSGTDPILRASTRKEFEDAKLHVNVPAEATA